MLSPKHPIQSAYHFWGTSLLALTGHVFLIAALVGFPHSVFFGPLGAADVGDVKEEWRVIDQLSLDLRYRHYKQPVAMGY